MIYSPNNIGIYFLQWHIFFFPNSQIIFLLPHILQKPKDFILNRFLLNETQISNSTKHFLKFDIHQIFIFLNWLLFVFHSHHRKNKRFFNQLNFHFHLSISKKSFKIIGCSFFIKQANLILWNFIFKYSLKPILVFEKKFTQSIRLSYNFSYLI